MKIRTLLAFLTASSSIALAQMGGGMPGGGMGSGSGNPSSTIHPIESQPAVRDGMWSGPGGSLRGMSGLPMMGSDMGVGMTDDLTVAPDGTAYVIRSVASAQPGTDGTTSTSGQFELDALSPVNGSVKWKLPIPGGRVSSPVLASDGLIFLSVDNYQMSYANLVSGGSMMTPAQAQANAGQVLIISESGGNASIINTIHTSSDVLSAPKTVVDPVGGYMIYVLGYDMMSWSMTSAGNASTFAPSEKTLYAYRADGSLKFSVKLSRTAN